MSEQAAYKLSPTLQSYAWGRTGPHSIIASYLGEQDSQKRFAELWYGAHPSSPSVLKSGAQTVALDQFIGEAPQQYLGPHANRAFGGTLPFLVKILSIGEPLSIQAHPDPSLAKKLHERDPEHYPDANHKPELAVALSRVELLQGFRPFSEIQDCIRAHVVLQELLGEELSTGLLSDEAIANEEKILRSAFERILSHRGVVLENAVRSLAESFQISPELSPEQKWIVKLASSNWADDPGVLSFLLLNFVTLQPGESIYTPANTLHAYLSGELLECMANSDNVVRAGLTEKHIDLESLLAMPVFRSSRPELLPGISESGGITRFSPPVSEFVLRVLQCKEPVRLSCESSPQLMLCTCGTVSVSAGSLELQLTGGEACFIPYFTQELSIAPDKEDAQVYLAGVPVE